MNENIKDRQDSVHRKIDEAYARLVKLKDQQQALSKKLKIYLEKNQHYTLLSEISDLLGQLEKHGNAHLFWGKEYTEETAAQHTQYVRDQVANHDNTVRELRERHEAGEDKVQSLAAQISLLNDESDELDEYAEEFDHEFVIEREMINLPYRPMVMPWTGQSEDNNRFRRILLICLLVSMLLGSLIPLWDIPVPDHTEPVKIPERLAKLILEKAPPPPPPKPVEKALEETPKEKKLKKAPKPATKKEQVARKKVESAGLLAFKNNFTDLIDTGADKKLGAQARLSNKGKTAKTTSRSLVTAQATGGSGGISTASLSRDVGGAGKGIKGVGFERIESAVGSDFFGEERPLSGGPGPSRTDEEIQIVFDRYKAALYRIYNRELRKNPTLQGKMVLRLTIEPDGSVSSCKMDSSDMDSPALESKIVARVLKFNFGPKDGVPPVTILYPIDFLPSS